MIRKQVNFEEETKKKEKKTANETRNSKCRQTFPTTTYLCIAIHKTKK